MPQLGAQNLQDILHLSVTTKDKLLIWIPNKLKPITILALTANELTNIHWLLK
jgi:hypothetical protein